MATFWRTPGGPPVLVAGPCVLESDDINLQIAEALAELGRSNEIRIIYKGSFDKANRARLDAPRGPGLDEGLKLLERVKRSSGLPILTDVHEASQVKAVSQVVDALQVPAFLCRQTDLLLAVGARGKPANLKKGQWMDPAAMQGAVEKVRSGKSDDIAVTERGTFFGYGDLVVDMRSFGRLKAATGATVLFDATHAVQQPGRGVEGSSGGNRDEIPALVFAAAATGVDGFFLETHPEPDLAPSDSAVMWPLEKLPDLVARALDIWSRASYRPSALPPYRPS